MSQLIKAEYFQKYASAKNSIECCFCGGLCSPVVPKAVIQPLLPRLVNSGTGKTRLTELSEDQLKGSNTMAPFQCEHCDGIYVISSSGTAIPFWGDITHFRFFRNFNDVYARTHKNTIFFLRGSEQAELEKLAYKLSASTPERTSWAIIRSDGLVYSHNTNSISYQLRKNLERGTNIILIPRHIFLNDMGGLLNIIHEAQLTYGVQMIRLSKGMANSFTPHKHGELS